MLKYLSIFIITIVLTLIVAVYWAANNVNHILAENKTEIEAYLSEQLESDIKIDSITINWLPFRLLLNGLDLCVDQDCKEKLVARKVLVGFDVWRLLVNAFNEFVNQAPTNNSLDFYGSVDLRDVSYQDLYYISTFQLKKLTLLRYRNSGWKIKFSPHLSGLKIRDGKDRYALDNVKGQLSLKIDLEDNISAKGDLTVKGFGFNDGETNLHDTDFKVNKLKADISNQGAVNVVLFLDGSNVKLDHESIVISDLDRVHAPLSVSVPATGGYEVRGPVTVVNSEIDTIDKRFNNLSGEVDMLVSGPLKDFRAKKLTTSANGENLALTSHFSMTSDQYKIQETNIHLAGGTVDGNFIMGRKAPRAYTSDLEVRQLSLNRAAKFAIPDKEDEISGRLQNLNFSGKGNFPDFIGTLNGKGDFRIRQSVLRKKNFTDILFDALEAIPVLGDSLLKVDRRETDVSSQEGEFNVVNRIVNFTKVTLTTEQYTVNANGTLSFEGNIDVKAAVVFLRETAKSIGMGFDQLANLFGRVSKIEIPIFITGKLPDYEISVDKATLLRDNSGITLVEKTVGGVADFVTSPFRPSKKDKPEESQETVDQ